jgi:hypothetical protein
VTVRGRGRQAVSDVAQRIAACTRRVPQHLAAVLLSAEAPSRNEEALRLFDADVVHIGLPALTALGLDHAPRQQPKV